VIRVDLGFATSELQIEDTGRYQDALPVAGTHREGEQKAIEFEELGALWVKTPAQFGRHSTDVKM
jgi:hypothetical protein